MLYLLHLTLPMESNSSLLSNEGNFYLVYEFDDFQALFDFEYAAVDRLLEMGYWVDTAIHIGEYTYILSFIFNATQQSGKE